MSLSLYTTAYHRGGPKKCAMDYQMPQRTGKCGADDQDIISFVGSVKLTLHNGADIEWLTLFM